MIGRKQLGKTEETIPEIGIGTWKMGGSPESEIEAIRTAIKVGANLVDTAEMYGNERMVGNALLGQKGFFLATKVSPHHFKHDDLIKACRESLEKLQVKSIDLYQLHWPNKNVEVGETMSAMEELVDKGLIAHIGVSNFSAEETREAQESMKKYEIVSNQVEYSLLVRGIEQDGVMDYCKKNGITILAYSPLARGAIVDGSHPELDKALHLMAEKYGKTPSQVALNWMVAQDNVVAIPKTSSSKRMVENAGASGWKMTEKERKILEDAADGMNSSASKIKPFISRFGFVSGAYQGYSNFKNRKSHKSSSTTKSSKK